MRCDWNPWHELGTRPHLKVRWIEHGRAGCIDFASGIITMRTGGTSADRRSVLTHELLHDERGSFPRWTRAREEALVREGSARRLIPVTHLASVLRWAGDEHEAAEELCVDVATLRTRLERLVHPAERVRIKAVMRERADWGC